MTDDRDHSRQGKHRSHARGVPIMTPLPLGAAAAIPLITPPDDLEFPPMELDDNAPVTGVHSGPELAKLRAQRPTGMRLNRLEDKHDALDIVVGNIRADVGEIKGAINLLPRLIEDAIDQVKEVKAREHVTFTAQVDVTRAEKIADIHDDADAKKQRRALKIKIAGGIVAVASSSAFLHWLIARAL